MNEIVCALFNFSTFPLSLDLMNNHTICLSEFNLLKFHMKDIMEYVSFYVYLTFPSILASRLINIITNDNFPF